MQSVLRLLSDFAQNLHSMIFVFVISEAKMGSLTCWCPFKTWRL